MVRLYCWYGLELVRRSVVLYFSDTDDADDVDFYSHCNDNIHLRYPRHPRLKNGMLAGVIAIREQQFL